MPLSIEPVLGWRVWRLVRRDGQLQLMAYVHDTLWPPQKAARATCGLGRAHTAPQAGCSCGFYAAGSLEALAVANVFSDDTCVIGAIAMWGTIVEHARGARSEYAYPARLRMVCPHCLRGGKVQDPAVVLEQGGSLQPRCRAHAGRAKGLDAGQVMAELLSTYAVELLPQPKLPWRPRPIAKVTTSPNPARTLVESILIGVIRLIGFAFQALMTLWILSIVVGIAVTIAGGIIRTFTGHDRPTSPTPVASAPAWTGLPRYEPVTTRPDAASLHVWERHHGHAAPPPPPPPAPTPFPEIDLPCGIGLGDTVELVRCGDPDANLIGWAQRSVPKGADEDCVEDEPYSHGRHWWVCWFAPEDGVWVHPWPDSANPFETPAREGGTADGDR